MPDKAEFNFNSPVLGLTGVGPVTEEKLAHMGISSVGDLLFHLPIRYQDKTKITSINCLKDGGEVLIDGILESKQISYGGR